MKKLAKPPGTQRTFVSIWAELDYVCRKMRYWLYTRSQRARAERYLKRLAGILRKLPENDESILREEGRAIFHELKGNRKDAIVHREREILLMQRLHKDARSSQYSAATHTYLLRDRGETDLQERRAILEKLKQEENPVGRNGRSLP